MGKYSDLVECGCKTVMSGCRPKNYPLILTAFVRDLLPSRPLKIAKNENIDIGRRRQGACAGVEH